MGKDFEKEISNLSGIYSCALAQDVAVISDFLRKNKNKFIFLVGSGGSFSVAVATEFLCSKAGILSKSITPLELSNYSSQIRRSAVILFTASGKNTDSINAYRYISELEPEGLLTICMRKNSPISKIQYRNLHNYFFEYTMPVKKDGYLAVESLISSLVVLSKAFFEVTQDSFYNLKERNFDKIQLENDLTSVFNKQTIIVLHGGLTTPVVVDLESKFSEVALGNIQTVDFRNFAHGRHFWISHRKDLTSIIAIVDNAHKKIANKTLELIPEDIPIFRIEVDDENISGLFDAYEYIFEIVNQAGKFSNINPGKPKVSEFGKKLYHINYKIETVAQDRTRKANPAWRAAFRKSTSPIISPECYHCAEMTYKKLMNGVFKGLIFDYDGTLHINDEVYGVLEKDIFIKINELLSQNIIVGIATGRGKSIKSDLRKAIDLRFWDKVYISYYNGGCVGVLSDDSVPNKKEKEIPQEFYNIKHLVDESKMKDLKIDGIGNNPYQLTIFSLENVDMEIVQEVLHYNKNVQKLTSSHSLDIIPLTSSKNNIIDSYHEKGLSEKDFLFVGDSGGLFGNDFELLDRDNGISVDYVSKSLNGCWNFAPLGLRNLEATFYLLEHIAVLNSNGDFKLRGF